MKKNKIFFVIPACNEGENLEVCLGSLFEAKKRLKRHIKTFICLNGCTDDTPEIAEKCRRQYKELNINLLESKKGKLNAQKKVIKNINSKGYVVFVDGDVRLTKNSVKKVVDELDKHPDLIAVGAFPVAERYKGKNPWKKIMYKILNIRSIHPESEISKLDVKEYHPYAFSDPQFKNTSPEHELKSKIYFHGRMFVLRSRKYWAKPKTNKIIGDDSFIPDHITYNYGKGRIRNRYDAIVYYKPYTSFLKHFRAYKRTYFDLKNLERFYPRFKDIREHSKLKLDKKYIKKQNIGTRIIFEVYIIIRKVENFLYRFSINKNPRKMWDNYSL